MVIILPLVACLFAFRQTPATSRIAWETTYASALSDAGAANKLLLIDFYTDWASYCKLLDSDTLSDPAVVKEVGRFVPLKLNAEGDGSAIAKQYSVSVYPTVILADKEGNVLGRIVGLLFPEQFDSHIENILDAHFNLASYENRYKSNERDSFAIEKLASIYAERGSLEAALDMLGKALFLDTKNEKGSLARALNAVGDCYEVQGSAKSNLVAASYYARAAQAAHDPEELTYADEKLAQCYLLAGKPKMALDPLRQALAVKGIGTGEQAEIQSMIDTAKQGLAGK